MEIRQNSDKLRISGRFRSALENTPARQPEAIQKAGLVIYKDRVQRQRLSRPRSTVTMKSCTLVRIERAVKDPRLASLLTANSDMSTV